jgi:hypothetical protein
MKSFEYFETEEQADAFIKTLTWSGAEPEKIITEEYGENNEIVGVVWIVYYFPRQLNKEV